MGLRPRRDGRRSRSSIAQAAKAKGAEVRLNAAVAKILDCAAPSVTGVVLADGTEFAAPIVASCVDANVTFLKLLDPKELPPEFVASVRRIDYVRRR